MLSLAAGHSISVAIYLVPGQNGALLADDVGRGVEMYGPSELCMYR